MLLANNAASSVRTIKLLNVPFIALGAWIYIHKQETTHSNRKKKYTFTHCVLHEWLVCMMKLLG